VLRPVGTRACAAGGEASARVSRPGWLPGLGLKQGGGPIWKENPFSFYFSTKQYKTPFLSKIKIFIGFGTKIKVAQNFIISNIALGFILKF
jgi:hypothetical protein